VEKHTLGIRASRGTWLLRLSRSEFSFKVSNYLVGEGGYPDPQIASAHHQSALWTRQKCQAAHNANTVTTFFSPVGGAQQEFSSERRIPPVKETIIEPANPLNMRVVGILALRELAAIKQAA
jgi:hypothetical protein